ncbi:MAG: hypothetical protein KGM99_18985 [Burkholderiales bacterium]|nr:hypothetical protein [Burkholderiales bacterium]
MQIKRLRSHLLWLAVFLASAAGWWALERALLIPDMPDVQVIKTAEFAYADSPDNSTVTPPATGWAVVALPDNWSVTKPKSSGIGFYRIQFKRSDLNSKSNAIFIKRVSEAAELYLNGHRISSAAQFKGEVTYGWNHAIYATLPDAWLAPENEIVIKMYAHPEYNGGVGVVRIGSEEALSAVNQKISNLHVDANEDCAVLLFAFGIVLLAFAYAIRNVDKALFIKLLLLGFATILWAIRTLDSVLYQLPMDWRVWGWLVHSQMGWVLLLLTIFYFRLINKKNKKHELFLTVFVCFSALLLALYLGGVISLDLMTAVWAPMNVYMGAVLIITSIKTIVRSHESELQIVSLAMIFFVLAELRDFIITGNVVELFDTTYFSSYASLTFIFSAAWLLVRRFGEAYRQMISMNTELENRITLKQKELEVNFKLLEDSRRTQIQTAERSRLLADMHDGFGSELVTCARALRMGKTPNIKAAEMVEDCLLQMQLIVDSASASAEDVSTLLAAYRRRIDGRLADAHIKLHWQVEDLSATIITSSTRRLHLMRWVQEAVQNAVKHSHCQNLVIKAELIDGDASQNKLKISIQDDGKRNDAKQRAIDFGISSLRTRSEYLRGGFNFISDESGTLLILICGVN